MSSEQIKAEIEELKALMESGKIQIRINLNLKPSIAKALTQRVHNFDGTSYYLDGQTLYRQDKRQATPYDAYKVGFKTISLEELAVQVYGVYWVSKLQKQPNTYEYILDSLPDIYTVDLRTL